MQHWPSRLWLVRHGESAGNVARDAAHAIAGEDIKIDVRDVDVPLSALGKRQGVALGQWFASLPEQQRPEIILSSPYVRAHTTAEIVKAALRNDLNTEVILDERLREREFGVLDRLTRLGIQKRYPELAAARQLMGKFYFRPPAGESWCDVILRLRSLLDTVGLHYGGKRVLSEAEPVWRSLSIAGMRSLDRDRARSRLAAAPFLWASKRIVTRWPSLLRMR